MVADSYTVPPLRGRLPVTKQAFGYVLCKKVEQFENRNSETAEELAVVVVP